MRRTAAELMKLSSAAVVICPESTANAISVDTGNSETRPIKTYRSEVAATSEGVRAGRGPRHGGANQQVLVPLERLVRCADSRSKLEMRFQVTLQAQRD